MRFQLFFTFFFLIKPNKNAMFITSLYMWMYAYSFAIWCARGEQSDANMRSHQIHSFELNFHEHNNQLAASSRSQSTNGSGEMKNEKKNARSRERRRMVGFWFVAKIFMWAVFGVLRKGFSFIFILSSAKRQCRALFSLRFYFYSYSSLFCR